MACNKRLKRLKAEEPTLTLLPTTPRKMRHDFALTFALKFQNKYERYR